MPVFDRQEDFIVSTAMEAPTIICREMAKELWLEPGTVREALTKRRVDICFDVLSRFGMADFLYGEDLELAVAIIANKWPEASLEDLSRMTRECLGLRIDPDVIETMMQGRFDLLRAERSEIEGLPCEVDVARRVVFFANRWPDVTNTELGEELGVDSDAVRSALRNNIGLQTGRRAERTQTNSRRKAWKAKRAETILFYALEHPYDSYRDISMELQIPYKTVIETMRRNKEKFEGMPPRMRSSSTVLPRWLELEDVVKYVDALDHGLPAKLPQTSRRF